MYYITYFLSIEDKNHGILKIQTFKTLPEMEDITRVGMQLCDEYEALDFHFYFGAEVNGKWIYENDLSQ
jgi:hypothetical protein